MYLLIHPHVKSKLLCVQVLKDDMWPNPLQYFLAADVDNDENGLDRYAPITTRWLKAGLQVHVVWFAQIFVLFLG